MEIEDEAWRMRMQFWPRRQCISPDLNHPLSRRRRRITGEVGDPFRLLERDEPVSEGAGAPWFDWRGNRGIGARCRFGS